MRNNSENKLVPKLRFPEFKNCKKWEGKKLGEVAKFLKGKGISKSDVIENGKLPCIRYGQLYTHYKETINEVISYTDLSSDNLVLSLVNDVIIPSSGETQDDIATASCVMKNGIALGGDLNIIRTDISGVFLSYYLNNAKKKDIAQMAQGISVVHLYSTQLKTLNIIIPQKPEQQKIAACLSSLDEVITAESQKLEALKEYKKGLLQNLFPQEGETVPKLRFKEFENSGEWEEKTLGKVCSHFKGFAFQSKDYTLTGRRIVRVSDMGFDYIKNETSAIYINEEKAEQFEKWKLQKDDLIVTTVGSKPPVYDSLVGRTIVVKSKDENTLLNQNAICLRANKNIEQGFLNTLFKRSNYIAFIESIIRGNANQGSIALEDLFKFKFSQPSPQEQQKIADCLSSLDDVITAQSQKVEALKLHKKGLLQGLFPDVNGVSE